MRTLQITLAVLAIASVFGCSSGDTPVETVQVPSKPSTSGATTGDSMKSAIQNDSKMPQAAKDALLGKGK